MATENKPTPKLRIEFPSYDAYLEVERAAQAVGCNSVSEYFTNMAANGGKYVAPPPVVKPAVIAGPVVATSLTEAVKSGKDTGKDGNKA